MSVYGNTRPQWVKLVYPLSKHVWDISQYYLAGVESCDNYPGYMYYRADSRLAFSQWEMLLQSNSVSHWLGESLESALYYGDGCFTLKLFLGPIASGGNTLVTNDKNIFENNTGLILALCPANERRCYKLMLSLTGWTQI